MEADTPLRPRAVAEAVLEEASNYLGQPLPRRWIRELIAEANTVYAHNKRFRRNLRSPGNTARDWLWVFMRHWLAAKLKEWRPLLHALLPASFNTGQPLPDRKLPASTPTTRRLVRANILADPSPNQSWAMAAHFHS